MTILRTWMEPHLDEFGPLLRLRHRAEEDRRFTLPRVRDLDARIAAHLDGVAFFAGEDLRGHDDPLAVCAALLRRGAAMDGLLDELEPSDVEALARQGGPTVVGDGPRAALVAGRAPDPAWFTAGEPTVRRWAWLLGTRAAPMEEGDPAVRDALRRRHPGWVGGHEPERLSWRARLATGSESSVVAERLWSLPPAPWICQALGDLGRSVDARELIALMGSADPRLAVAAGTAFSVITGADIDSGRRVALPPEDGSEPDDFSKEFLDEAWLPDPVKARAALGRLPDAPRLNRGFAVDDATAAEHPGIDRFAAASAALRRATMGACPSPGPSSAAARW